MKIIDEVLKGIVSKVTYHNPATGWSVLRVHPPNAPQQQRNSDHPPKQKCLRVRQWSLLAHDY